MSLTILHCDGTPKNVPGSFTSLSKYHVVLHVMHTDHTTRWSLPASVVRPPAVLRNNGQSSLRQPRRRCLSAGVITLRQHIRRGLGTNPKTARLTATGQACRPASEGRQSIASLPIFLHDAAIFFLYIRQFFSLYRPFASLLEYAS